MAATRRLSPSGDVGPLGFTGEYTDPATGFVYLRARWYDPATAEFITRDPAEALTGDPYSYAANSPLALTDPLGLWPSWEDVGDAVGGAASWAGDRVSDVGSGLQAAGEWALEHRGTIATVLAVGACIAFTGGSTPPSAQGRRLLRSPFDRSRPSRSRVGRTHATTSLWMPRSRSSRPEWSVPRRVSPMTRSPRVGRSAAGSTCLVSVPGRGSASPPGRVPRRRTSQAC